MRGIHLTKVTRMSDRPRVSFFAEWLIPMGFVPDTLAQFMPEENGFSLTLCENVPKYSELVQRTREKGGSLIHVNLFNHREHPNVCISGVALQNIGLAYADMLLIRYEYGFMQVRKLPHNNSRVVTSRVFGQWLAELGFAPEAVLTVASEPNLITCTLQENGQARTHELVKYARDNKLNLLQVSSDRDNNGFPQFEIPPSRFEKAGLHPADSLLATGEYGRITLRKLDFEALGF